MRHFLVVFAASLISTPLLSQGIVLPRPCARPCPIDDPCPPCRPERPTVFRVSSDVRAELIDQVLRYEVTEIFVNRGGGIGEADYIFPLPKGAAFQDLKLSINGELVAGETMNSERARRIYEQIVRQQRDPALVEWMGYGMLRARIFPIAPGERKKVVVRFQMVAQREGDALRVDYFRGRRTNPGDVTGSREEAANGNRPQGLFTLTYPTDVIYGTPYSPTHSLSTSRNGNRREVRVRGDAAEIAVLLPVRRSSSAAISVLTYAPRDEDGFALVTLSPPATAPRVTPRDVTLVLDVSGSMAGAKIRQARAAGRQVLGTLSPSDRFRLIDFSTDVRTFRDKFLPATPANIAAASRYLDELDASGSTNISGALDAALEGSSAPGRLGLVLFVTDGEPTVGERNPEAIAARVARRRGERRIFSFGVGAELNAALVERLALEGHGTAHFVRPDESVERAVSIVASRLTSPVITDLRVSAQGVRLLKRHPSEAADIFAGQDFMMLARYDGSGTAQVRFDGQTVTGPVSYATRVAFPASSRENSFIARLWATQRVGYLSAEKRRNGGSREIDSEIRELGERYSIPTEFTSYLVLEPGMRLDQVVVTGVATTAVPERRGGNPPPPPAAATVQSFEAARAAAAQRSATNLNVADEADFSGTGANAASVPIRRIGARTFTLRGGVWVDSRRTEGTPVVKVRPFSSAYFRLMELIPELREAFALGERVSATGRKITIEVTPAGSEKLTEQELASIQSRW